MPTGQCLKSLLSRKGKRQSGGQTTVEFALICLPFFIILFAIIDYAQIYFYENSLQNGMREAARFATAGRVIQLKDSGGAGVLETNTGGVVVPKAIDNNGVEASRYACIRFWFLSNCVIQIPISDIVVTHVAVLPGVPPTTSTNDVGRLTLLDTFTDTNGVVTTTNAPYGPGAANDYIQISASYTINTITPLMTYLGQNGGGYSHGGFSKYKVTVSSIVKNEPALLNFQHAATNSADIFP